MKYDAKKPSGRLSGQLEFLLFNVSNQDSSRANLYGVIQHPVPDEHLVQLLTGSIDDMQ